MSADSRINEYLHGLDTEAIAILLDAPYAPGVDEWRAVRLATGRDAGTFGDYLNDIGRLSAARSHAALVYFDAIDDDDYVPSTGE